MDHGDKIPVVRCIVTVALWVDLEETVRDALVAVVLPGTRMALDKACKQSMRQIQHRRDTAASHTDGNTAPFSTFRRRRLL